MAVPGLDWRVNIEPIQDRAYWRAVLNGVGGAVILTTEAGIIREFNAHAERLLDYGADEVIGRLALTQLHEPRELALRARALSIELGVHVEPAFEALTAAGRSAEPSANEWTYLRKGGARLPVLLSCKAVGGSGSSRQGFVVLLKERPAHENPESIDGEATSLGTAAVIPRDEPITACSSFSAEEALHRLNGDAALLLEVVELFQREQLALRELITSAVNDRDPKRLARAAHKLRGALLNLAARRAAEAALVIEDCGRSERIPESPELDALGAELDLFSTELSSFRRASVPV